MKKLSPILILSLLFLSCGDSQQEYIRNDLVEMDNGLWTEKFSDEPITGKVYDYFGEESNPKKVHMGNIRDGKKEGKWVSYFHSTGKKKSEYNFKDGEMDGLHTQWYENGQKKWEGNYKDGKKDGLENHWFENGQKEFEVTMKDGKKNGIKSYEGTFKDGKVISFTIWNKDGSVKE